MKKLFITGFSCFLFVNCQQISQSIEDTLKPNDTVLKKDLEKSDPLSEIKKETLLLEDVNLLRKAEQDLRNLPQYAGKEIFLFSTLYFYNYGSINAMLVHPENPKYVDVYEFKEGKWSEPKPVQLSVRDDIKSRIVSLQKISFVNAAKMARVYNEKSQEIEGAKPATSVYISIWDNKIRWYPSTINGSRERYSIEFNDDGSLKNIKQD
ncbi:hypothetical protein [Flavobacterium gelatinilyticum]|uniref:hypothetical protein n=1 Tax=Flavobacterium gelatinilyticum TaxID=3003260 RepID=UPI0024815B48|nr:hypothetical protein [Flavobacterium gelatinilyticum]